LIVVFVAVSEASQRGAFNEEGEDRRRRLLGEKM